MNPLTKLADLATSLVGVRFGGPLTTAPPKPEPSHPLAAPATPDDRHARLTTPPPGLQAWDCVLDCPDGCTNRDGEPVRAGQSCRPSARLMGLKRFPVDYPELHLKAVRLGIISDHNQQEGQWRT